MMIFPCHIVFATSFQKTIYGANVVIFEGILAFANRELIEVSKFQL